MLTHVREDLEDYQVKIVDFIRRTPRCAIWIPMSAGKTVITLTAVYDCIESLDACRVLVVAPMRVAEKTWSDEIEAWAHTRGLRYMFLTGSAGQIQRKIEKFKNSIDLWGISCDAVHNLALIYNGRRHPFDWVVIDESSRFKNPNAKRTKSLSLLTIHPLRVTELTGTPSPNGIEQIWSQIFMLDRGERLGRTMADFKRKFFVSASGAESDKADKTALIRIQKAIADIVYVLRAEDFKSHRKPELIKIPLSLGAKLKKDYETFKREYILTLADEEIIKATNVAGLGRKLLQFTSGMVYDEDKIPRHIHDIKINALRELIEDNAGTPFLVAYGFQHEVTRIKEAFPQAEQFGKDPLQQDRWNRGEIPILLAHPRSAGHGLNLQFGGHNLVWFSQDYDLEQYQQLNARLPRPGQKNQVMIHHLVMEGTIDEMIMRSLTQKDNAQESFQRELKKHIIEVLESLRLRRAA